MRHRFIDGVAEFGRSCNSDSISINCLVSRCLVYIIDDRQGGLHKSPLVLQGAYIDLYMFAACKLVWYGETGKTQDI